MSISVNFNAAFKNVCVSNFFMMRRAILDRNQELVAYELAFHSTQNSPEQSEEDCLATAAVITHFTELGLEKAIGAMPGFVRVDGAMLMGNVFDALPCAKIVFEISESSGSTAGLCERVSALSETGIRFALIDVHAGAENTSTFFPFVELIKLNPAEFSIDAMSELISRFQSAGKKLLAEKIETSEQFERCVALGFDFFQGTYFSMPNILPENTLSPSHVKLIQLMTLLASEAESADIEQSIKSDVALGLNLLRLVNTAAVSTHRIDSLKQALILLGRNQLQRWLQIMLYTESHETSHGTRPLLMLATTRGKLLELVAQHHRPGNLSIADTAFTVGIMSLMDTLFGLPMDEILKQIAVVDEVSDALLYRKGYFGELLKLVEYTEKDEKIDALQSSIKALQLSCDDLYLMQLNAFEWSNDVSHAMD